jgi:hypothetical protein
MSEAQTTYPFRKTTAGRVVRNVRQKCRRLQRELFQRLLCRHLDKRILIILGCQRSGTTMLGNLFTNDMRAAVLQEQNAATVGMSLRLRPWREVNEILHAHRAPLIVIKPIVESQWAPELLENIADSRVIWMYREYRDVVHSNVKRFHSQIEGLRIAVDGNPPSWRNERLSQATQMLQKRHYQTEMSREDAAAVGWCARNSLYFELGLDARPDVLLLKYEELVRQPQATIADIYRFLELPLPRRAIWKEVDSSSLGRGGAPNISPELAATCNLLQQQLNDRYLMQRANAAKAPEREEWRSLSGAITVSP